MNKLPNKLILLAVVALFFSALVAIFSLKTKTPVGSFYWKVVQARGDSEEIGVDVFLKGEKISKVLGAEVRIFFDDRDLKLISVTPAGFFPDPIQVKWDEEHLVFSLIQNPERKGEVEEGQPVVRVTLSPGKDFTKSKFYVLPMSQIYVSEEGGAYPKETDLILR